MPGEPDEVPKPRAGNRHPAASMPYEDVARERARLPESTHTTFDPAGAFTSPCSSAPTGAAAAPSGTSFM